MTHLTDEQLESMLQGQGGGDAHLQACDQCRARLAEKQAIAQRLRSAFAAIQPPERLMQGICTQVGVKEPKTNVKLHDVRNKWVARISAMAAVFLIGLFVVLSLSPSSAHATQTTLAEIHKMGLSGNHTLWTQTDPNELAEQYQQKLGVRTQLPPYSEKIKLCTCCIAKCLEHDIIGTYMAVTEQGNITVAIVEILPDVLGKPMTDPNYYQSQKGQCNIVAVRIGEQTYCAVGQVEHRYLQDLLQQL
jgi:hypothetical protein